MSTNNSLTPFRIKIQFLQWKYQVYWWQYDITSSIHRTQSMFCHRRLILFWFVKKKTKCQMELNAKRDKKSLVKFFTNVVSPTNRRCGPSKWVSKHIFQYWCFNNKMLATLFIQNGKYFIYLYYMCCVFMHIAHDYMTGNTVLLF